MQETYMVVKKSQLTEHSDEECAGIEAMRLAHKLNSNMYVVKVVAIAQSAPYAPNAGKDWTRKLDEELLYLYMSGNYTPRYLAKHFGRTAWAISCRLEKFQLNSHPDTCYRGW